MNLLRTAVAAMAAAAIAAGCSTGDDGAVADGGDGDAVADGGDGDADVDGEAACDDGDPCTVDLAAGDGGCRYEAAPDGTPCPADGDPCTWDVCEAGSCGVARAGRLLDAWGRLQAVGAAAGGELIFAGTASAGYNEAGDALFVRVDGAGQPRWERRVDLGGDESARDVVVLSGGGGLAATGSAGRTPNSAR